MRNTLFAWQVFLRLQPTGDLRRSLRELVVQSPSKANYRDKWSFYRRLVDTLKPWEPHYERGVWDYIEEPDRAQTEFDEWREGTEADADEAKEAAEGADPYRSAAGGGYMFVTLLFLMQQGSNSDRFINEQCRIPEDQMWLRPTFGRLLATLPMLNFANVLSDVVLVRPNKSDIGIGAEELADERYNYLRELG